MLNNDAVLVTVKNMDGVEPSQGATVNLEENAQYNVVVQHQTSDEFNQQFVQPSLETDFAFIDGNAPAIVNVNVVSDKNQLSPVITNSIGYSALAQRGIDQFQSYASGDLIEFSPEFQLELLQNRGENHPMFINLEFDASDGNPIQVEFNLEIPLLIRDIFPRSFVVEDMYGNRSETIYENDSVATDTYSKSLSTISVLNTVI